MEQIIALLQTVVTILVCIGLGFLAPLVSAAMLFSLGFHFSRSRENRNEIFQIAGIGFLFSAAACLIMQGVLLY